MRSTVIRAVKQIPISKNNWRSEKGENLEGVISFELDRWEGIKHETTRN